MDIKDFKTAEIQNNNGIKKRIIALFEASNIEDECSLSDVLYRLQFILNDHQEQVKSSLGGVSGSWLDHHILNEDSEIDGVIIKHHHDAKTYGGVAVKTNIGNFAIVKEDQEKAAKNKGANVRIKPHKEYYGTVIILKYQ